MENITKEFEKELEIPKFKFDEEDKEVLEDTKEFMKTSEKIRRLF